jgi:hypothetical protein
VKRSAPGSDISFVLIIARVARLTFVLLLATVVLLVVAGGRPVEPQTYGRAPVATTATEHVTPATSSTTSTTTVPGGVRAASIALLAVGGAASIAALPRRRTRHDDRRILVGPVTLAV